MKRSRHRLIDNCKDCGNWFLERKTIYDDGSEIVNYKTKDGKGNCKILNFDTAPDFGCVSFIEGNHIEVVYKSGSPWQNWHYDVCPICNGRGNPGDAKPCERCWGTGHVRYYDDGFIGDERTQLHPNESKPSPVPEITIKKIESKEGIM